MSGLEFRPFRLDVSDLLLECGVSRVGKFWLGPSPAVDVDFGSRANIQEFLQGLETGRVREGIEAIFSPMPGGKQTQSQLIYTHGS